MHSFKSMVVVYRCKMTKVLFLSNYGPKLKRSLISFSQCYLFKCKHWSELNAGVTLNLTVSSSPQLSSSPVAVPLELNPALHSAASAKAAVKLWEMRLSAKPVLMNITTAIQEPLGTVRCTRVSASHFLCSNEFGCFDKETCAYN